MRRKRLLRERAVGRECRRGKGQDGRRGQSWGSMRGDEVRRVRLEGEEMRYGVVGKVELEGRVEKC